MRKPSPATVLAFLALIFAMGGFAIAANESAETSAFKKKVKTCYSKKTGELRVAVKGKRKCRRAEKKLVLNKKGRRGKRGLVGPQGPAGPTGATGPVGPQGPAGLSGSDGSGGGVTLGPGTVGSEHIADGSIIPADLAPNLITDDLLGLVIDYGESANNHTEGSKIAYAECPVGTQLVGGGGGTTNGLLVPINTIELATGYNGPTIGNDWAVTAHEVLPLASPWQVTAWAICIRT